MLLCWLWLNFGDKPGVIIIDQTEAEGPQFSDPNTLDIVTRATRTRVCPSETQRWVWRKLNDRDLPWHDGDGEWHPQAIPLLSTVNPFLADDGRRLVMTLPSVHIPDRESGEWMFRSVTTERCGFLPTHISEWFGSRVFRSRDVPVNFIGGAHH